MNFTTHTRRFFRSPYEEPALADARLLPMKSAADYEVLHELSVSNPPRVLVNYAQYYRVLSDIAAAWRAQMKMSGPLLIENGCALGASIPESLLGEDVFFCDRIKDEIDFWRTASVDGFLVVKVRIPRDSHEYGDNTVTLELHSQRHCCEQLAALVQSTPLCSAAADVHP